uniref:Uncharacterized protein n=1 Tax=Corethron hystrix TaxID=216773 RepID=A0A7S1BWE6_9STRA|mmetsp:Transcript_42207/g.98956  ORF Transcript_42207/g.98956 Transcript_42207/m.98956 type:complete len:170 (+) Transcript_42207:121-630(+)
MIQQGGVCHSLGQMKFPLGIEKGNTMLPPDLTADGQKRTVAAVSEDSSQPTSANSSAKWLYTESPGSSKSDVSKRSLGQVFHKALATPAGKQSCKEVLNSAKFKLQRVVDHRSIPEDCINLCDSHIEPAPAAKQSCIEGLSTPKFKLQRIVNHRSIPVDCIDLCDSDYD